MGYTLYLNYTMENVTAKKYSAIEMFNNAPAFRETQVKVDSILPAEFFVKCKELFPTAESEEVTQLKKNLNDFMMEKAQKKHKNYLRRQRAKLAKLNAQKEKEQKELQEEAEKQQTNNKFDTWGLSGSSDSGVSVNSTKIQKNNKKLNVPKGKTVQKYSVVKTPEIVKTPEVTGFSVRQPVFSSGLPGNFVNQGKLRASTDDRSVIGNGSSSTNVFAAKPVSEPRTWSNSRLNKNTQRRGRIGSRS